MSDGLVTLRDGRRVSNVSEEWRAECEARYVANMPNRAARQHYLGLVQGARGIEVRRALEREGRKIFEADVAPKLRAAMAAQEEHDGSEQPEAAPGT